MESPPLTSFKPDTSLPKVNVPEFVITGKAQIVLPEPEKQSVEIDSTYFQGQNLQGIGIAVPANSLSIQGVGNISPSLYAQASIGSYTTTNYLLSGSGDANGYFLHGSLAGDYTSGFVDNTMRRDMSVAGGFSKAFRLSEAFEPTTSMDVAYSRGSYSLYGGPLPGLVRATNKFAAGIVSDFDLGELPLSTGLSFERFSINDLLDGVQAAIKLQAATQIDLSSASIGITGSIRFGSHTINGTANELKNILPLMTISLDNPFYNLKIGADYNDTLGNLAYSIGLDYFQYEDDSSNGIAKLYPDLRANYNVNDVVSLFSRFYGTIDEPELSSFITVDRYIDALLALRNTQNYANFTLGARVAATNELAIIPKINLEAARFFPIYVSDTAGNNELLYSNKASVFTASITAEYKKDRFSADATLNSRAGAADSLSFIPNLPLFDFNVDADYQITAQLAASGSLLILSGRYSDIAMENKLSAAWILGVRLSYSLTAGQMPIEIFAEGNNLLDQKYYFWQGYREFPLTLSIGISKRIM